MDPRSPPEQEIEQPGGASMTTLIESALEANKAHQYALTKYAERLTAELQEMDELMSAVNTDDGEDEPAAEIQIPGAKKAVGPCPPSEFLNPDSPFFEDASRRARYINQTTAHPMKAKELEALAEAVRGENQRLQALELQKSSQGLPSTTIDLDNNTEGIDWTKIAEKVSTSSNIKRTAEQCRIKWIGDRHPRINHKDWTSDELNSLSEIVHAQVEQNEGKVDWVYVASELGTNRTPVDCMRRGFPRQRHTWNHISDQKLLDAVQLYGTDNWSIVARVVSEDATSAQCQGRYYRALDPSLKRGPWSEAELARLKVATEAYGNNWMEVAACMPGRTNEQCRERWMEYLNMFTGKEPWTEGEDQALMDAVKTLGNQWKAISIKLGKERTGAQCRLRYEKLKKLKNPQTQGVTSSSPAAQSDGKAKANTTTPLSKAKTRAKKSVVAATAPEGTGSEPPTASTSKPRPKARPVGKKGKEKAADPATLSEPTPGDIETPNSVKGNETISPMQGKRGATQGLDGAPPSKKKRTTRRSGSGTDVHPQNATGAAGTPKKTRNPIRTRRAAATASISQNEVSQSDSSPLRDAQEQAEEVTEPEVEGSNLEGRLKVILKVGSQLPLGTPETATTTVPGDAPQLVPRARGRSKKITTASAPMRQYIPHTAGIDVHSPTSDVDVEAASSDLPDPIPKGRKKNIPLPAPSNAGNTPKVVNTEPSTLVPRRQSARVAAKN